MQEQLYNSDYLNQTANLLKTIKELSYAPFLSIKSGAIVDVGCGTGQDIFNIASLVSVEVNCIGVDADPNMIATALTQNQSKANLKFQEGSADDLPFDNEQFEGLRNERLIQHLPNPEQSAEGWRPDCSGRDGLE
jgi:ubiquinone/menaquinone biosynthesis C-methylase UbiE